MKTKIVLSLVSLFLLSQAVMAQTSLTVSASIPAATGLQLTVTPVNSTTNAFGTPSTTATTLPFGTLTFNPSLGIYLPDHFFAIDIGTTGGAGTPTVDVTYTEGANPNGVSTNGLGTKSTATFVTEAVSGGSTVESPTSLGKKRLIDLTGTAGELTSIPSGSFERVYVGIWTGSTKAPADPSNGKPFANTDVGGTYTGTLTFTAVSL